MDPTIVSLLHGPYHRFTTTWTLPSFHNYMDPTIVSLLHGPYHGPYHLFINPNCAPVSDMHHRPPSLQNLVHAYTSALLHFVLSWVDQEHFWLVFV